VSADAVVQAAIAWRDRIHDDPNLWADETDFALIAAVDALRAGPGSGSGARRSDDEPVQAINEAHAASIRAAYPDATVRVMEWCTFCGPGPCTGGYGAPCERPR
jgi:hypothetical protein